MKRKNHNLQESLSDVSMEWRHFMAQHKPSHLPKGFPKAGNAPGLTPDIREVWLHWDVVDPRLQLGVEELQPLFSHVEDEWATQEKVFQAETGRHSPEIKQVPGKGSAKRGPGYTFGVRKCTKMCSSEPSLAGSSWAAHQSLQQRKSIYLKLLRGKVSWS